MVRSLFAALFLSLLLCGQVSARPQLEITTDAVFDPAAVPAFAGDYDAIYRHIDDNLEAHIAQLQRWVRQRSISAQNDGIAEMAELVASDLRAIGFDEVAIVPTDGHPGVFGYYDAGAEKTLLVYMMYDVQPVDDNWQIDDPFAGTLVENELGTVLMARGVSNQKGPQRAFLNAVESTIATTGSLPVNLYVVAEGEEELGSMHFDQILAPYLERLRQADGAFFPMNLQAPDGSASLNLGVKGILYFELEARGGAYGGPDGRDIHGSYRAVVDSPAMRLVEAIASLTSADANTIVVEGYYEGLRGPTEAEQALVNHLHASGHFEQLRDMLGVPRWIDGLEGSEAILRYLFEPTMNINGINSGYTGEGGMTILPHRAVAKMDSRLPPGLDADASMEKIRAHLIAHGYGDIEVRQTSGYPAASSPVDAGLVQAMIQVLNKYQATPMVSPWLAGSAPFFHFTETLDLPFVFGGLGLGGGAHAPDEYMLIHAAEGVAAAGLAEVQRAYVDLLHALAEVD
jgi:acetylornithine deacetylase/succinyl-diaminopimelate desuccinylase-like protein